MGEQRSKQEWKKFKLGELFKITIGKNIDKNKIKDFNGKIPYITRKSTNNGLEAFITYPDQDKINEIDQPVITIGNETAVPFVQSHSFYTGTKVNILKPYKNLSEYVLNFICVCIQMNSKRYSYSYTANSTRLKEQLVLLPVTENNQPDYEYMEQYIESLENKIDISLLNKLDKENNTPVEISLSNVEWKEFFIQDVFQEVDASPVSIDYSVLENKFKIDGRIPYVTRTSKNNGISAYIRDLSEELGINPVKKNCITIGLDTATINYQPTDFYTGQNIHVVRDSKLNKYSALFIIPFIEQSLEKFGWGGYSATLGRFRKTRIMLPSLNNKPDWGFMEKYIKSLPNSNIV